MSQSTRAIWKSVVFAGAMLGAGACSKSKPAATTPEQTTTTGGGTGTGGPATADDGSENWTVPGLYSTHARLRVVARDAQGHTGFDMSDADFTINGQHCDADFNNDGFVNGDDYDAFASAFEAADISADVNHDGFVNGDDFDAFASHFEEGC